MFSKKKGTVIGTPGASSRHASSKMRQGFSRLSWKARIGLAVFGSVAGLMSALALGLNPLSGIALLAAFTLFVSGLFIAPAIWAVISVLALYAVIAIPAAGAMVSQAAGSRVALPVAIEAGLSLITAALLVSWFAMRFSRTSPWKALAWALAGSTVVGFASALLIPAISLNAALLSMMLVTAYWCGGRDLVVGATTWMKDKFSKQDSEDFLPEVEEINPLKSRAGAESATADIMNGMNSDTLVFHDVVAGKSSAIPHVVISTTGVALVHSVSAMGHLTETKKHGLEIPGVDLNEHVSDLLAQRVALAGTVKIREDAIRLVIAVHGASETLHGVTRTFAIYSDSASNRKIADIHVVSGDELLSIVDTGLDMWNPLERRAVTRRARMKLQPAYQKKIAEPTVSEAGEYRMAVLDDDGRETTVPVAKSESEATSWMLPGTPVLVETSQGLVGDIIITGELVRHEDNSLVAPVCAIEEWQNAQEEERSPEVHWFKVENILRDNS